MKIHKTTRITIEEQKVRTISVGGGGLSSRFCERCGTTRAVFSREMASAVLQISWADIGGLIEAGQIHFVEIQAGSELICGHSLTAVSDTDRSHGQ